MLISDLEFVAEKIQSGAICVLPTDTVYGLVASAEQPDVVDRVYEIKGRIPDKPFIILISDIGQLDMFAIRLTESQIMTLEHLWPGPISIILPCNDESFTYLHRGLRSLAFRVPDQLWLRELVHKTGPVIATSANKSGQALTNDIDQIMKQLPKADLFIEGSTRSKPSQLGYLEEDGSVIWIERSER